MISSLLSSCLNITPLGVTTIQAHFGPLTRELLARALLLRLGLGFSGVELRCGAMTIWSVAELQDGPYVVDHTAVHPKIQYT
jgi:hypothetical protein